MGFSIALGRANARARKNRVLVDELRYDLNALRSTLPRRVWELERELKKEKIRLIVDQEVEGVERKSGFVEAKLAGGERVKAQKALISIGRALNTGDIGLEEAGVALAEEGHIRVNGRMETGVSGIYAAGDVLGENMFVYTAAYEGALAAENALTGTRRKRDYTALPWVVFTDPQVAAVGVNERNAAEAGIAIDVAKLPLSYVSRALT